MPKTADIEGHGSKNYFVLEAILPLIGTQDYARLDRHELPH